MDRAAFLRSLSFLRPLPPGAWDCNAGISNGNNEDEEPYSGSTITPPTPSKNNAIMLFEESPFVVSIEPIVCSEGITENGNNRQTSSSQRKRGRDDDELPNQGSTFGPAFFECHSSDGATSVKTADDTATAEVQDAMDVDEPDNNNAMQKESDDAGETDLMIQINSDSSLCTFEAAILKKLPTGDVLTTPSGQLQATNGGETESKSLIFRFGNHFVFQVDESAITELRYEPGEIDEGGSNAGDEAGDEAPASKRQRNEGNGSSQTEKAPAKTKQLPSSLVIAFGSCNFRVFSLEGKPHIDIGSNDAADDDTTRPSSRIWGTLAKTVESVENRLMKARSVLLQHFEIERSRQNVWKMAQPGSGVAFQLWPGSFEYSSFHSNALMNKTTDFLEEDWAYCLGKKRPVECQSTATSPQKSSSPSKGTSSSSFEHGQKEQIPTKNENGSSQKGNTKSADTVHSSELTHESQQNEDQDQNNEDDEDRNDEDQNDGEDEDFAKLKENLASSFDDVGENGEQKKTEEDGEDNDGSANSQPWRDDIFNKYHLFETSAAHIERAMPPASNSSSPHPHPHLTFAAESLSSSYLTANEFMHASQHCENDVQNATSEMNKLLDKMFPARGRKSNDAATSDNSEDYQKRVEELMNLRREAVAAKLALLMTPKRCS